MRVPDSLLFPFRQEGRPGVGYRLDIPLFSNGSRQFLFLMRSGITDALLWEPETLRTGIRWGESLDSVYTSYAKTFSQRAIQRTCTAAANAETVLAYRVAIPRQRLR